MQPWQDPNHLKTLAHQHGTHNLHKHLGISRATTYRHLKKHGIKPGRQKPSHKIITKSKKDYTPINLTKADRAELLTLQKEWTKIDQTNLDQIKNYFNKYFLLQDKHFSWILGKHPNTIKNLRHRLKTGQPRKQSKPRALALEIPQDWRTNREWLSKYSRSPAKLAKALKISSKTLDKILRSHEITYKPIKHPCQNHKWLHYHYIEKKETIKTLAQLAQVPESRVRNWLTQHKIRF